MTLHKIIEADGMKLSDDGSLSFYASVFGTKDLVNDIVLRGAFADSLGEWRKSGDPVPIVYGHDWVNPGSVIGGADPKKVIEDTHGLLVAGKLDVDTNPEAKQVHRLIKRRLVKAASFAYDVRMKRPSKDSPGVTELVKLGLIEVGPCLKGAHPDAGDFKGLMTARELNALFKELEADLKQATSGRDMKRRLDNFMEWLELEQSMLADA